MSRELARLQKFMDETYNLEELKNLCLELDIDDGVLGDRPKEGSIRELLQLTGVSDIRIDGNPADTDTDSIRFGIPLEAKALDAYAN